MAATLEFTDTQPIISTHTIAHLQMFDQLTMVIIGIANFDALSSAMVPEELALVLALLHARLDDLLLQHGCYLVDNGEGRILHGCYLVDNGEGYTLVVAVVLWVVGACVASAMHSWVTCCSTATALVDNREGRILLVIGSWGGLQLACSRCRQLFTET
eukprot:1160458-Pelagomonas_calceolata.AAC.2